MKRRPVVLVALMTLLLVALLGGGIWASLVRARERSNRIRVANCLRSIQTAALLYSNANGGSPGGLSTTQPAAPTTRPADEAAVWELLRAGGNVVFMRHAATGPGSGEPANFDLNDPTTQRNLSDAGRAQARRIGATFSREGVTVRRAMCSQYARCRDTGALAFGAVQPQPALNALSENETEAKAQVALLRQSAADKPAWGNVFLITHQSNILAVTGIKAAPGECVVVTPLGDGTFHVAGRLDADKSGEVPPAQ